MEKRKSKRSLTVVLRIVKENEPHPYYYTLTPLQPLPGERAWRLTKLDLREGDEPSYDVRRRCNGHEEWVCECLGWLRWGKCKHVDAVKKLLETLTPQTAAAAAT